jgi:hypothetical protein
MQHASNVTHLHNIAARQQAVTGLEVKPKLLDQLREALRSRHYSHRTEQTYCHWVKRFIYFHNVRHPSEMGEPEINAFLTHLAVKEKVSASTQNQALSALLFVYRHVLGREIGDLGEVIRARKEPVLSRVRSFFSVFPRRAALSAEMRTHVVETEFLSDAQRRFVAIREYAKEGSDSHEHIVEIHARMRDLRESLSDARQHLPSVAAREKLDELCADVERDYVQLGRLKEESEDAQRINFLFLELK